MQVDSAVAHLAAKATPRSEQTRGAILDAAEIAFAEYGYEGTRLQDIAEAVGIRRASIVYYFRDKRELYDAVLGLLLGAWLEKLAEVFEGQGTAMERIEASVFAWVDFVIARPTFARIVLREVAGAGGAEPGAVATHIRPFFELVGRFVENESDQIVQSLPVSPEHLASAIAGSTLFFVAAMPALLPGGGFDPLNPQEAEAHRNEIMKITRRLLGTDDA